MRKLAGAFNLGVAAFIGLCALGQLHSGSMIWFGIDSGLCALNIFLGVWNLTACSHNHGPSEAGRDVRPT